MSQKHLFEVSYVDRLLRERDEARAEAKENMHRLVGCLWLLRDDVRISDIRDSGDMALSEAERRGFDEGINTAVSCIASDKRETLDEWALGEIVNGLIALKHDAERCDLKKAEQRGYQRGVEAALGAARSVDYDDEIVAAILALLETEPGEKK